MNEFLLSCAAAIHHIRQAEALADAQLLGHVQHRLCRWLTAEHVVRDAAERKHIEARAMCVVGTRGLGREVDQARVFHVVLDVARAGGAMHRIGRRRVADVA